LTPDLGRAKAPHASGGNLLDNSPGDWFGGWSNATQGMWSAVVGGLIGALVAVGTSLLVVRMTQRHERRMFREGEARQAMAQFLSTWTSLPDEFPPGEELNEDFRIHVRNACNELAKAILLLGGVDVATGRRLATEITAGMSEGIESLETLKAHKHDIQVGLENCARVGVEWLTGMSLEEYFAPVWVTGETGASEKP
jgi:hypothetical protein